MLAAAFTPLAAIPAHAELAGRGEVDPQHGYPTWYSDGTVKLTYCYTAEDGCVSTPPNSGPASYPDNFPDEAFYMLAGAELDLPGGGRAVLVLGLEAAFANTVTQGDQVVFGRQRVVVKGGPANTTLTFQHPYGTMTIDTDGAGSMERKKQEGYF